MDGLPRCESGFAVSGVGASGTTGASVGGISVGAAASVAVETPVGAKASVAAGASVDAGAAVCAPHPASSSTMRTTVIPFPVWCFIDQPSIDLVFLPGAAVPLRSGSRPLSSEYSTRPSPKRPRNVRGPSMEGKSAGNRHTPTCCRGETRVAAACEGPEPALKVADPCGNQPLGMPRPPRGRSAAKRA